MITIKNIEERQAYLTNVINLHQAELNTLDALLAIYKQPHYLDVQELDSEESPVTTPAISTVEAVNMIKNYCYANADRNTLIRLTAVQFKLSAGTFYRAIDILVKKEYLNKTGQNATYIWLRNRSTDNVQQI